MRSAASGRPYRLRTPTIRPTPTLTPMPEGQYSVSIITEIELLLSLGLFAIEEQKIHQLLLILDRVQLTDAVRDKTIIVCRKTKLKKLALVGRRSTNTVINRLPNSFCRHCLQNPSICPHLPPTFRAVVYSSNRKIK